jgi:hypothetical protein
VVTFADLDASITAVRDFYAAHPDNRDPNVPARLRAIERALDDSAPRMIRAAADALGLLAAGIVGFARKRWHLADDAPEVRDARRAMVVAAAFRHWGRS